MANRVLSDRSFNIFAKKFCKTIAEELAPSIVKMPENTGELQKIEAQYKKLGFPGAVGSMDGVQFAWEACPFKHKNQFTGKETKPTIGFNFTVDHNKRIMNITHIFAGRYNDKTKLLADEYVHRLKSGKEDLILLFLYYYNY